MPKETGRASKVRCPPTIAGVRAPIHVANRTSNHSNPIVDALDTSESSGSSDWSHSSDHIYAHQASLDCSSARPGASLSAPQLSDHVTAWLLASSLHHCDDGYLFAYPTDFRDSPTRPTSRYADRAAVSMPTTVFIRWRPVNRSAALLRLESGNEALHRVERAMRSASHSMCRESACALLVSTSTAKCGTDRLLTAGRSYERDSA